LDADAGMIELSGNAAAFASGDLFGVLAWYQAGYTLPVDNVGHTALTTEGDLPDAVRLVTNRILKAQLDAAEKDAAVSKERIADYWWEGDAGRATALVESFRAELAPYMKHDIAERSLYEL
jgi:hypothetical protein